MAVPRVFISSTFYDLKQVRFNIGDFIKNYMQNESAKLETTDNELKIEIEIPGDNKYFNKQILYVNNNTKNPDKMEILNSEGEAIFIVKYKNFKYKK